ncbi:MAG: hypothetical protein EHM13_11185 [Acidobacteria bacterium]|nr:MAG: hypothetical protein EHM13_11185 [Acidobacteriota bacterium]
MEGYGVFFDVDLPPLPRSFAWTFRILDLPLGVDPELAQLQRQVAAVGDVRLRQELDQTLRLIQRKVAMPGGTAVSSQGAGTSQVAVRPRMEHSERPQDPFASYATDLGTALAEVLVNYGGTITLRPDEWLTIAARESQPKLLPGGPVETAITLRIKGADLAAFKAGRLNVEEARKKVEIKEF